MPLCCKCSYIIKYMKSQQELDLLEIELNTELDKCKNIVDREKAEGYVADPEDFNKRGELYKIAFDIAPNARREDIEYLFKWIQPQAGEKAIDVAAGTGMFSIPLAQITQNRLYAVDPSDVQLKNLDRKKGGLNIVSIVSSLSESAAVELMKEDIGNIDFITSYGGIHHILDKEEGGILINKQKEMFKNANIMLKKGGRFVAGDVGNNTDLSRHFEGSVKTHCLTGHHEKWLSTERLENELLKDTDLVIEKVEQIPVKWHFNSERELALYMKGLHAYHMSNEEVLKDLNTYLQYTVSEDGTVILNWPMFFFHLVKN